MGKAQRAHHVARATGMILVTNNEKEFARVKGLLIENWCTE